MKTKGQAAMEFLMTYGWAILAAIIVIGVLAVYFRPGQTISDQAILGVPFYGVGAVVGTSQVQVEVRNNGGEDLTITDATLSFNTPNGAACNDATGTGDIAAGASLILTFGDCNGLTAGSTVNAGITISYERLGSELTLSSTGSVTGSA